MELFRRSEIPGIVYSEWKCIQIAPSCYFNCQQHTVKRQQCLFSQPVTERLRFKIKVLLLNCIILSYLMHL